MNAFPYIPDYMIETVLGEGGMATVYMGVQQKLQRKVAIKILDPVLLKQPNVADRFLIEAQTAANLSHPNIISIFDVGQVGKYYYIVMECLDGSLKDLINSSPSGKLPVKESLNIIRKTAPALDYAHGAGIIHRDIKPDNIMFRRDGTPVLVDFGIARAVDSNLNMTKTGMGVGTPHYMSPEQVQSGPLDGRSDFYSLGVVLYLLLTGKKPYDADTILAVALKHLQEPVPKLPESLSQYQPLLDKMMAKDKENRVQNGRELQKRIDDALQSQPPAAPAQPIHPKYTQSPEFTQPPPSELHTQLTPLVQPPPPAETPPSPQPIPSKYTQSPEFTQPSPSELHTQVTPLVQPPQPIQPTQLPPDTGPESAVIEDKDIISPVITTGEIPLAQHPGEKPRAQKPKSKLLSRPDKLFSIPNKIAIPVLIVIMSAIFVYFLLQGIRSSDGDTREQQAKGPVPAVVTEESETARETPGTPEPTEGELNEAEFERYYSLANDYYQNKKYDDAKTAILEARGFKTTPELDALEAQVDRAVKKKPGKIAAGKPSRKKNVPDKQIPLLSDDETYKKALSQNTAEAYRQYLDQYPTGRHVDQAISKSEQLKEGLTLKDLRKAKPKRTHHLRTAYKTLSYEEVEAMIRRYGFFEDSYNKSGNFRSLFEKQNIKGGPVIVDHKSGLMWHPGGSPKAVQFRKINKWLRDLNRRKYAGFSDWRLPTLEEASSLLRRNKNSKGLYTDPIFSGIQKRIWSGDRFGSKDLWVVRFYSGIVYGYAGSSLHFIRPVRSVK